MAELGDSLERMTFMQLALLFTFVTSYVLALGRMLGRRHRGPMALLALTAAVGFGAMTDPWEHGALLVVFVVAGLGLFVLLAWLVARAVTPRPEAEEPVPSQSAALETASQPPQTLSPPLPAPLPRDAGLRPASVPRRLGAGSR